MTWVVFRASFFFGIGENCFCKSWPPCVYQLFNGRKIQGVLGGEKSLSKNQKLQSYLDLTFFLISKGIYRRRNLSPITFLPTMTLCSHFVGNYPQEPSSVTREQHRACIQRVCCCFSTEDVGYNFSNHETPFTATYEILVKRRYQITLFMLQSQQLLTRILCFSFKIGPCAQPEFLAGPARDLLLTLVVPAPSQQWCRSHPEDASKAFHRREMELKEAGQVVPNDMVCLFHLPFLLFLYQKRTAQQDQDSSVP